MQRWTALRTALDAGALSTISGDRLRHELDRIVNEANPLPILRRADELGILAAIHPALSAGQLRAIPRAIPGEARLTPLTWLAALVWPLTPTAAAAFAARINATAGWQRVIDDTIATAQRLPQLAQPDLPPSRVCGVLDGLSPDALAAARLLGTQPAAGYIDQYLSEWWSIAPLLRGHDLLALGVPGGPAVGEALRALRQARLDGLVRNRQEELDLARQWAT